MEKNLADASLEMTHGLAAMHKNHLLVRFLLHGYGFIVGKGNRDGLARVEIFNSSIAIIAGADPNIASQGKDGLPFVHSRLNLMMVNCLPYFPWPVTIQLMRILHKQDFIYGKLVTTLRESPYRKCILTRCFFSRKNRHCLFLASHSLSNHVFNLNLFEGSQEAG